MIKSIFLLAAIPTASFGFHPSAPPKNASHRSPVTVLEAKKKRKASGKDNLSLRQDGPLQMEVPVDVDRARDCAENFGKCSRAEMKDLRDGKSSTLCLGSHTYLISIANLTNMHALT